MAKLKHSKYKNTGILFELILRQITSDTIENKKTHSLDILKKFFNKNTLLFKEQKLYSYIIEKKFNDPSKAEMLVNECLKRRQSLDNSKLASEKYNLIKEIKFHYDINNFFKAKITNYKELATIFQLFEYSDNNPIDIIEQKTSLIEHITKSPKEESIKLLEEFKGYDKELRLLTLKLLTEKFNEKYSNFNHDQKSLLREYINQVTNTPALKENVNNRIKNVKKKLTLHENKTKDRALKIKLKEINSLLTPIEKNVLDKNISHLLNYYELINELDNVHG